MKTFREYILNEGNKYRSAGTALKAVKKTIANSVELLAPEAFETELKNDDAGMGGHDYIQIVPRSTRTKDMNDIKNVKSALENLIKKDMDDMKLTYYSKSHIMVIKPKSTDEINEVRIHRAIFFYKGNGNADKYAYQIFDWLEDYDNNDYVTIESVDTHDGDEDNEYMIHIVGANQYPENNWKKLLKAVQKEFKALEFERFA
jgi:hypothetical protein